MLEFLSSRIIFIYLASIFSKAAENTFICIWLTLTDIRYHKIYKRHIYHQVLPSILLNKSYYLTVVIRTSIMTINTTVFILGKKAPMKNFKFLYYWIIISVPHFSWKCLLIIYFHIGIIYSNNKHFQPILSYSYQLFQVFTLIYNY